MKDKIMAFISKVDFKFVGVKFAQVLASGLFIAMSILIANGYLPKEVKPLYLPDLPKVSRVEVIVTRDNVNVRSGPGKEYNDVGDVNQGDVVVVTSQDGEWCQIGFKRFVFCDFLRKGE